MPQGIGADLIATIEGWSRDDVDAFALESQKRAAHARDSGWFDRSVVPVRDENGLIVLEKDDFIKPDTDMQKLGSLRASFEGPGKMGFDAVALSKYPEVERINHVHTPGNSSGIVDGASLVMVGNEKIGKDIGLDPRGRVLAIALTATDPTIMLTGPGPRRKGARQGGADHGRHRPCRDQQKPSPRSRCACNAIWTCRTRNSTSWAVPSPWVTRLARPAAVWSRPCWTSWNGGT